MKERKILIAAILIVTLFGVSTMPVVQGWWKKDAGVTAEAGVKDVVAPTAVTYDYANFDAEIKNHKTMTITLDNYGTIYKDRNYELGSAENPFIVLEIVPYEGYAEFGYLVTGCEPIGFDRAEVKYASSITEANSIATQFNNIVTGNPVTAEQKIGYADYYSNPAVDADGEPYPEGYLSSSRIGTVFGKFVKKTNGAYQIDGSLEGRNISVTYKGSGGNYDFEPDYTGELYSCFGSGVQIDSASTRSVPVYNASGENISQALIFKSASEEKQALDDKVYAYYEGKYGYFATYYDAKTPATKADIRLDWSGDFWSGITQGGSGYGFFEETGVISYFDSGAKAAPIKREGEAEPEGNIWISYGVSTSDNIYASMKCYRPKEFYYQNGQTEFMTNSLAVADDAVKDYHVKVLTVTPQTLNELAQRKDWNLIDAADYISFNDTNHVSGALATWGKYYNKNFFSPSQEEQNQIAWGTFQKRTFLENDISWAVAVRLLCKISIMQDSDFPDSPMTIPINCYNLGGGDPYSIGIPSVRRFADGAVSFSQGSGSINNITKLYLMLELFETDEDAYFYNHFIKTGKVTEKETTLVFSDNSTKKITTGYFDYIVKNETNRNGASLDELELAALYWGPYTFLDIENTYLNGNGSDNAATEALFEASNVIWFYDQGFEGTVHTSVRNNVYTFNNGVDTTQYSGIETFEYADGPFQSEPFEIIEFSDRSTLTAYDVMYYLLHQEQSSLSVLINGSLKSRIYSNVDYEADNVQMALEVGQIVKKDERLYGRVQFNIQLNSRKGSEDDLDGALVQFNIYREDVFDNPATMELENFIPVRRAYLLSELEKPESERVQTRLKLGLDYYYDVPLELLEGVMTESGLKAATTEDIRFSALVCYGLKDREQGEGNAEDDYKFIKNIYSYEYEQDENGKITKVVKDERKTLTFVRRAMFNLD